MFNLSVCSGLGRDRLQTLNERMQSEECGGLADPGAAKRADNWCAKAAGPSAAEDVTPIRATLFYPPQSKGNVERLND